MSPQRPDSESIVSRMRAVSAASGGWGGSPMRRRSSRAKVRMPAKGLLISWATTAASRPSDAIFSTSKTRSCVARSSDVFSSTRRSSSRFMLSSAARDRARSPVSAFQDSASVPISSLDCTGTRLSRSPRATAAMATASR
jgi:hypothetical protein